MQFASDEVLIEKSRQGDMTAFKALVNRYEGKVAGITRSMLGQTVEAEDVGQEVFIRFYEHLQKFRGDSQLSTYLIRIAMNLSLNELKRRKRNLLRLFSIEGAAQASQLPSTDLNEQLTYEIGRLDADFRAVVTLRLIEGYSTEETAELLGIPLGTVLSRLARAQKKLQIALTEK